MASEGERKPAEDTDDGARAPQDHSYFQKLITDNLQYIEKQCHKACSTFRRSSPRMISSATAYSDPELRMMHTGGPEALVPDTLLNEVLDRLKANDYRALRNFENRSRLTTYITTIIANLVVDIVRKSKGRSRAKERTRLMGAVGERLYELVFAQGYTVAEAYETLKTTAGTSESLEEIEAMVDKMRGRNPTVLTEAIPDSLAQVKTTSIASNEKNPHETLLDKQREDLARKAINEVLIELGNEDRLLIRMRFPLSDDEEPKSLPEIAYMLGTTQKAVDGRIRRALTRCREAMLRHGLGLDDFIDTR